MEPALEKGSSDAIREIALKAYARIAERWGLTISEAAALADMSDSTWKRAKKPNPSVELTNDQTLRLSAIVGIYKGLELYFSEELAQRWVTLPNQGPLMGGARPVDSMIEEGLPQILRVRNYLDTLRGGL